MQYFNNEILINKFQKLNSLYFIKLISQKLHFIVNYNKKSLVITRL